MAAITAQMTAIYAHIVTISALITAIYAHIVTISALITAIYCLQRSEQIIGNDGKYHSNRLSVHPAKNLIRYANGDTLAGHYI